MVSWFWLMVDWFGLMVAINWMGQVMTVMHHVGHVWVLLHVVHGHPQGKDLFQGEGMALVGGVGRDIVSGGMLIVWCVHRHCFVRWLWSMIRWFWSMVCWFRSMVGWFRRMIGWFWSMICWFWSMVCWLWSMVCWLGDMVCRFWMVCRHWSMVCRFWSMVGGLRVICWFWSMVRWFWSVIFSMLEHENVLKRTAMYRQCIATMFLMMMFMVYHWSMVNWRWDHVGHVDRMVKGLVMQW